MANTSVDNVQAVLRKYYSIRNINPNGAIHDTNLCDEMADILRQLHEEFIQLRRARTASVAAAVQEAEKLMKIIDNLRKVGVE